MAANRLRRSACLVVLCAALSACEVTVKPPSITSVSSKALRKGFGLAWVHEGLSVPVTQGMDPTRHLPARMPSPAVVTAVTPGSAAERAGFQRGDVIVLVNGQDGRANVLFPHHRPGTRYTVRVARGGGERELRLEMGPLDGASPTGF
jgi:S1-C subfamily serine protease